MSVEDGDDNMDPAGADPVEASSESKKIEAIATVVPVHTLTSIKRKPGRPRKVNPMATATDLAYHAEIEKKRAYFIDTNPVVKAIIARQDSPEVLQKLKEEAAKEAASLHFQRIEEAKYGRDTSQISSRHLAAIREVASLELEMRKLGSTAVDLKSEKFVKIFKYLVGRIKQTAESVLSPEQAALLLNRLVTDLEGWEDEAQGL